MTRRDEIRPNEVAVPWLGRMDAGLVFIGVIRTPWSTRAGCPHHGYPDGPVCRIEVHKPWDSALEGIEASSGLKSSTGCTRPGAIWCARAREEMV